MAPTTIIPKLALASVAALGLYAPTLGLPLPDSCLRNIAVAGAAPTPSPSCGADLRECLRASADMRQTTFGGRYVTADDVARCMEAFNSCISGGASRGGNGSRPPSTSASARSDGLPLRFTITINGVVDDCRRDADSVNCTTTLNPLPEGMDTFKGTVTGTLSGQTLTGTRTINDAGHQPTDPACRWEMQSTDAVTLRFSPDGTVAMKQGPGRTRQSTSGTCHGTGEFDNPASESTGTWAPK